ncbi:MAG: thiamine phosphate synthase [Candidatus Endonucleobacter sp. (ex Gigantidas childressi)]|nr:thiamine phosphate synthase [Candidatus Endonucleobacter sp. (ex Gigantidas childressi)]
MPRLKGLCGITDNRLHPDEKTILETVELALIGGMKMLQYRNSNKNHAQKVHLASMLKMLCHHYQALMIINDDIELAASVEADGVHLHIEDQDGYIERARQRLGDYAILGISVGNSIKQAQSAIDQGIDYITFGCFSPKTSPNSTLVDISVLSTARGLFDCPIVAVGGITADNAPEIIAAGADMIAVTNSLFAASDIRYQATKFSKLFAETSDLADTELIS